MLFNADTESGLRREHRLIRLGSLFPVTEPAVKIGHTQT